MCEHCGCGETGSSHSHGHEHGHTHDHDGAASTVVEIGATVLEKNDRFARDNRRFFSERGLYVVNLISSPGSGKTALLEALAQRFGDTMAVVEGDVQTRRDVERVIRAGSRAWQIETGGACHLDAHMVRHALEHLDCDGVELLVIENVGNLVCPATFDLGEHCTAGILSLPEGDDKILKYPALFSRINALIINKIDLAGAVEFDTRLAVNECRSLNRRFEVFELSAKTGAGVDDFAGYLRDRGAAARAEGT